MTCPHGELSVGFCDPLRVYTTIVRVLRYVYDTTSSCELPGSLLATDRSKAVVLM